MVSGGVNKCMKYALLVFNLAFVAVGVTMIVLGVSSLHGFDRYLQLVESHSLAAPPKLFIAIGVIMFLIAFLGCCGAWVENHIMVMSYSVLVGLVLVLQLGVGIAAFLLEDDIQQLFHTELNSTLINYHNTSVHDSADIRRSWDIVQNELHCCGVTDFKDWKLSNLPKEDMPKNDTLIPSSCCKLGIVDFCAKEITYENIDNYKNATDIIFTEGCLNKAMDQLAVTRLGAVAIGLGVVQLLGVILRLPLGTKYSFLV